MTGTCSGSWVTYLWVAVPVQKLLREHAPRQLLAFMFKHGQAAAACELLFPPTGAPVSADTSAASSVKGEPVTDRCN